MRKVNLEVYKINELPEDVQKTALFNYQALLYRGIKNDDNFIWGVESIMFKMLPDKGFSLIWEHTTSNKYQSCRIAGFVRDFKKFAKKFKLDLKGYDPDKFNIEINSISDKVTYSEEWRNIEVEIYYLKSEESNSIDFIIDPDELEKLETRLELEVKAIVMGTAKTLNDLVLEKQVRAIYDDDYAKQELITLGIEFYKDGRVHTNLGKVKDKHWLVENSSLNFEELGLSDLEAA